MHCNYLINNLLFYDKMRVDVKRDANMLMVDVSCQESKILGEISQEMMSESDVNLRVIGKVSNRSIGVSVYCIRIRNLVWLIILS